MYMLIWIYVSGLLGIATGSILLQWQHTDPLTAMCIMLAVTFCSILGGCYAIGRYRDKKLKVR